MRKPKNFKYIIPMLMGLIMLTALLPLTIWAANLLSNGGFNTPFYNTDRQWNGQFEKVANGWNYFYIAANTYRSSENAPKLHWMSSSQFASTFGGLNYRIEGDASQVLWSSYEFDAGVYQQVSGLTPGHAYKFFIKMTTYWRGPGYPDTNGVMVKRVGIDPYGGTDPTSANVIWSAPNDNDKSWEGLEVAATAETGTMTVFAKVYAPENTSFNHTDLDMVYFEDSRLEYLMTGATTTLTTSTSGTTVNLDWSSTASGVMGYEVQYRDTAAENWVTLQDKTGSATSGFFTGQRAHSYVVRARTWQSNGSIQVPGRWQESNVLVGEVARGRVTNHAGTVLDGVTVSVNGTATSTLSANGGQYALDTGAGTFSIIAQDFGGLAAPPAGPVTVPANGVGVLDITLRPTGANQGLENNDFESGLSHWDVTEESAIVSDAVYHTGSAGLLISGSGTVSQIGMVTGMLNPLLSFWYKADTPFTVEFLAGEIDAAGLTTVRTQVLDSTATWRFVTIDWPGTGVYNGAVGVNFSYTGAGGAEIFIDEVSIAAGPYKTFLPLVTKGF